VEGQLVQKTFTLDNISFDCWVIKIGHKLWFKAHDIAFFLGYQNPNQAVRCNVPPEEQKQWDELKPAMIQLASTPPNWKPNTVLISEGGLYRLLCRSKKPEAINFEKWVFDEVLPTLRETGTYATAVCDHNSLIKLFETQLQIKDLLIIKLQEKVAVITNSNENKHAFQLYKHRIKPNKYVFIRTQSKYLQRAIKTVNPERYDKLLNEANLPNSMNILNRLKEKLVELHISFEASKNKLTVDVNVLKIVQELLQEPWI